DERPQQPRPDRALMISRVARVCVAFITRAIALRLRRERAQSVGREQFALDRLDCAPRTLTSNKRMRQTDGENLIRPDRSIRHALIAHAIVKPAVLLIPK